MRTSKKILRAVSFLLLLCLFDGLVSYALVPYRGCSAEMWNRYYALSEENIDTVYVGSSQAYVSIDPEIMDRLLGTNSVNTGTNSQSYLASINVIQTAIADHPTVKNVVFVLDYYRTDIGRERYAKADATVIRAQNNYRGLWQKVKASIGFMTDSRYFGAAFSLNYLFPWTIDHVNIDPASVLLNVRYKMLHAEPKPSDYNDIRTVRGFKKYGAVMDFNEIGKLESAGWSEADLSEESMTALKQMILLCQQNDINLTVVVAPVPAFTVISQGEYYFAKMNYMKNFYSQYGVAFFDMSLSKEELYTSGMGDFRDTEHLNMYGAVKFSTSLAGVLEAAWNGEDLSDLFYTEQEFLSSIDHIVSTYFEYQTDGENGIALTAGSYTGTDVEVEYQFLLVDPVTGTTELLRDYAQDESFLFQPDESGQYEIRVNARTVGSENAYDRYYQKVVLS